LVKPSGQFFNWSPLQEPTVATRLRAAPPTDSFCFSVFMRIAVNDLQFYHNGTGGANK